MAEWSPFDWVTFLAGYFGIAGLALWLVDRSHRRAFDKLSEIYDKTLEHQRVLIEVIKMDIDAMKKDQA